MARRGNIEQPQTADRFTVRVAVDYDGMSQLAADAVTDTVQSHRGAALTLPTGETPRGMYQELVSRISVGRLDFSTVQFFCLDDYLGKEITDEASLTGWLQEVFLQPAHVPPTNIHFIPATDPDPHSAAARYDRDIQHAGGLELAVVGIGLNGHVGFNEPGSAPDSRTRVVDLTSVSREQNAAYFDGEQAIPERAITMGLGTILEARRIVLIVSGSSKAEILRLALEGPITSDIPASHLRSAGSRLAVIADADAVSKLSRI